MSTRCNVAIYNESSHEIPGALLYHHDNGFPEWMGPELERSLKAAWSVLLDGYRAYWWDPERVAALMIAGSFKNNGVPKFQPCMQHHWDIAYLWKVHLVQEPCSYKIEAYRLDKSEVIPEWVAESELSYE